MHSIKFHDAHRTKLISKYSQINKNHKKCSCYNDLLNLFITTIDYKFNEQFINGSKFDFNQFYLAPYTSSCSYLLGQSEFDGDYIDNLNQTTNFIKKYTKFKNNEESNQQDENIDKVNFVSMEKNKKYFYTNKESNKFTYLLAMRCIHVFLTLINKRNKKDMITDSASTILDDYRLKNFFCLFKLADFSYDEYFEIAKLNALTRIPANASYDENKLLSHYYGFNLDDDKNWQTNTNKTGIFNHLFASLDAQRSLLKNYIDNYFYPMIE